MTGTPNQLAIALVHSLDGMSPLRYRWLVGDRPAETVLAALRNGSLPDGLGPWPAGLTRKKVDDWFVQARRLSEDEVARTHRRLDVRVVDPTDPRWPFGDDPDAPEQIYVIGDLDLLTAARPVAVVGTRRCTGLGRAVAHELGRDLASAGATVVSGLALGIDAAAHRGALEAGGPVVGVVANGLNIVYPRSNRALWERVGAEGLLVSETPVDLRPQRWRFPARNRLIASLGDGLVVVESHERGGALLTAEEAADRGRPVMAVPGSVLSPASDGTNALLIDGAVPVRHADDVLDHLGWSTPPPVLRLVDATEPPPATAPEPSPGTGTEHAPGGGPQPGAGGGREPARGGGPEPAPSAGPDPGTEPAPARPAAVSTADGLRSLILAEVAARSVHADDLVAISGEPVAAVLAAVEVLRSEGLVAWDGSTVSHPGRSR